MGLISIKNMKSTFVDFQLKELEQLMDFYVQLKALKPFKSVFYFRPKETLPPHSDSHPCISPCSCVGIPMCKGRVKLGGF